ncbi:MAG: 23S rRNA (guanosine(2251)-2'-O)-methyltransferase RlmB [Acidimicrobiales bacterium]
MRQDRRGLGGDQVEGRQAVRELLLAERRKVREVWVSGRDADGGQLEGPLADLADLAGDLRVPVRVVGRSKLDAAARTDAPQGVVAFAAPLPEVDLDDLMKPKGGEPPFVVALDGVTDPGNLGAVLRAAECSGVTGAVLPRHRAVHVTPAAAKAAAGAIEHVPMAVVPGLPAALARLKGAGLWVVGLDSAGDTPLHDLPVASDPVVLVLGAEGAGLSRLVRQRCDLLAAIPLHGRLASLNVAAAAAVATYEIARHRAAG